MTTMEKNESMNNESYIGRDESFSYKKKGLINVYVSLKIMTRMKKNEGMSKEKKSIKKESKARLYE